jgi:xylulose-5-phosphate/fructose-6-phosphate phosphoketolase
MPAQQLAQPNPPAERSQLPESLLSLSIRLNVAESLSKTELHAIKCFRKAACYMSAGVPSAYFLAFPR